VYWAADVRSQIDQLLRTLDDPAYPFPADLGQSAGSATRDVQRFLRRFGELLRWWGALWERARELRSAGFSLAHDVR
jgi:hypothetical protein